MKYTVKKPKVGFFDFMRLKIEKMHDIATEENGLGSSVEREIYLENKEGEASEANAGTTVKEG